MLIRFRSWWHYIRKHRLVVISVTPILLFIFLIWAGYWLKWNNWTGFSAKTLWDWLQLLLVPVILTIGGYWLNQLQKSREERSAEQQAKTERKIASDNQ